MSIPPLPSTLTPPRPIRPTGEVPDSQDDDEGHSSGFEDLMEELGAGELKSTEIGTATETQMNMETGTRTATSTSASALNPTPRSTPPSADPTQSSTILYPDPDPEPDPEPKPELEPKEATPPPPPPAQSPSPALFTALPLPLPSMAAHVLLITKPPVSGFIAKPQALAHPTPSPASLRLLSQISTLQLQVSTLNSTLSTSNALLSEPTLAPTIVKKHIKLLHAYNEIKDVGLGLMGLIADGRGVRVGEVMKEMGVGEKD